MGFKVNRPENMFQATKLDFTLLLFNKKLFLGGSNTDVYTKYDTLYCF